MNRYLTTEDTSNNSEHIATHHHQYLPILFTFTAILTGVIFNNFLPNIKFIRHIPYTGFLFVFWFFVSLFNQHYKVMGQLGESMESWINIDPHLLLFAFLPALLFGDAKETDTHLLFRKMKEILILAFLGVSVAALMSALVYTYVYPYDWSFNMSMVLGSILAATDPVAVVALLNDLGK